jgi:3-isopropylmalate/(R)-2-methylmalate dehydratase small subunit
MTFIIKESSIDKIVGTAIPKPANDQNTDDIVPARYLKEITFANMGNYVYFDERYKDGQPVKDHPFNDEKYKGANILLAGANYGCGSSREHAPQALKRFGIKAIVAQSFAEIFAGNCASLGVVGVTVNGKKLDELIELVTKNPSTELTLSLSDKYVGLADGFKMGIDIPEGRRQAFLNGTWDAMTVLQQNQEGIKEVTQRLDYLRFR